MRRALFYIMAFVILAITYAANNSADSRQHLLPGSTDSISQNTISQGYTTSNPDSNSSTTDTIPLRQPLEPEKLDTAGKSTLTRLNRDKVDIEDVVTFSAKDSLVMFGQNNAYLYGDGIVKYTDLELTSSEIRMNMDSSMVYANGVPDSVGQLIGTPVFKDKGGEYESKTMAYNFKTQRGYITDVITEQGEGYLTGGITKKLEDGTFNIANGRYTTCDDHDHPHFYFNLTKAKVRPQKNIVTGPVYMVLADVPLPLALPFGFFPFSKSYSSGIIFPTFGDDYNRGFYLRDGGYYFAINDNVDLALRGEIYTKGSWGISARSSYVKRYKFNGNFDISYLTTITGDKGSPDYSKQNNFRVQWSHTQDPKANPNMTFSAAVNFATSGYTRNDLNSYYNSAFTENTTSSTVNMTYRFPGSKWSFSTTANITQRTQDSTLAVSFPNITVSMSQTAPFKRKHSVGGEKWYEKIKMSYSGQFQNSLTARQDQFFKKSLIRDWRNAMKHSIPISATFSIFKYINISPSISLNDRMYSSKIKRDWDSQASREILDTIYGFYNIFDFNASVSLDTKIYGFWKPLKIFGNKIQMIRHVLTPTISFSASPDFGSPFWGYYGSYSYIDQNGNPQVNNYNYFSHGLFGSVSSGKTGMVSVNLANNLEMKVKSDADSTGVKKISLIENLAISQSYNFAADSMRWSNINTSIMLRLIKNFNLNLSATWDPYMYALNEYGRPVKVDKLRIGHGKLPRLSSTGTSFSYTFNNNTFKRKKKNENSDNDTDSESESEDQQEENILAAASRRRAQREQSSTQTDEDGYAQWDCPWSLTLNYSVNYGYGDFNYDKMEYKGKWTQNLSLNGNIRPTKNWNFSFSASYNFELKKIAYMNCSISRDLHCFTMSASFVPLGPYKSYNFHIAVKSSLLSDLKYDKRSSYRNGIQWY
ncbi:MAG: LPS-assembly protein LptD [Prevotella sp.]|nr:LPS-assembly protein LptD [Bacteroides sp.]MCM1366758.1 LPS-assembly protein LptD [Prevotella sp.]MCM1437377.1 LPS-assembly protein LptD [Prevotella sp.]